MLRREGGQTVTATLKLRRDAVGLELRRGTFDVVVDGSSVGTIEWHNSLEVPIEPGAHTIQIRAGRYSSRDHPFTAADGEVVAFRLHGAMVWPRYVVSIFKPDLAISLRPLK
jgi:hypothetical protein